MNTITFDQLPVQCRHLFGDGSTILEIQDIGNGAAYKVILKDCTFRIVRYYVLSGWALVAC